MTTLKSAVITLAILAVFVLVGTAVEIVVTRYMVLHRIGIAP